MNVTRKAMGEGTKPGTPLIVEVDNENTNKDIDLLDIEIPVLTPGVCREYKNLSGLDIGRFGHEKVACKKNMGIKKKRGNRFVFAGCFKTLRGFSHSHEGQKKASKRK